MIDSSTSIAEDASLADVLREATCPACGHHVAVTFFDPGPLPLATLAWPASAEEARAMPRLPHAFVRCVDCGHVYNSRFEYVAVPYKENANRMYNRGAIWSEFLARVRDLVLDRVPAAPVVVEIGCGEGHLLRALAAARPGGRYVGFDPNGKIDDGDGAIEARPVLFDPAIHLAELRPHMIVSRHVLEHLTNPLGFVQSLAFAAAWAEVETRLFLEVPCIDRTLRTGRTVDFFYEHHSHFTTKSLACMLARCATDVELVETGYNEEVVYGLAQFSRRPAAVRFAADALAFHRRAAASRETLRHDLDELARSGRTVAVWGGTGKAAAFLNQHKLDRARFPLVVDSDRDKAGTFVPGTGQEIHHRDWLLAHPVDTILVATQWRAADIAREIDSAGIAFRELLIEHEGRLVDYHRGAHPYREDSTSVGTVPPPAPHFAVSHSAGAEPSTKSRSSREVA
ncbi:MAG: class I SAM-dependent methyltransferase [Planctomycetales bacterium]